MPIPGNKQASKQPRRGGEYANQSPDQPVVRARGGWRPPLLCVCIGIWENLLHYCGVSEFSSHVVAVRVAGFMYRMRLDFGESEKEFIWGDKSVHKGLLERR